MASTSVGLRLRWSWRDLRQRWVLVTAIALILAIGTGIFASLTSTATWRRLSNDASFAALNFHDLEVSLSPGETLPAGSLRDAVAPLTGLEAAEERLIWPTQIDASTDSETVLVPGRIVGAAPDATVNQLALRTGTWPEAVAGEPVGLLERSFAAGRNLPEQGTIRLSGGQTVRYTGSAMHPEYFYVINPDGTISLAQGAFGIVFVPLDVAQLLTGQPAAVNNVVLTLAEGTDAVAAQAELEALLDELLPGAATTVTNRDDEPAYTLLYEDIENDQQVWNLVSFLILLGASFAAFNLISRIVEAQRRELGIGMALGVNPGSLAVRPLLVGLQIAVIGVVAGIGFGLLINQAMRGLLDSVLPLPVWETPFQVGTFVLAALFGLAMPFLATAIPVWRAVRVEPIEAIRTGHAATGRRGWARVGLRVPLTRKATHQYPFRNLLRAPRRTLLTALAIGASITVMVAILGLLDSFGRTIADTDEELRRTAPDRVVVRLATFQPVTSPAVQTVAGAPSVGSVTPGLEVPAEIWVGDPAGSFRVLVEAVDFATGPWQPTVRSGTAPSGETGILLSPKAASDLGVAAGGTVVLRHPVREGLAGYRLVDSELRVAGTHALPSRATAYVDITQADLFGLTGVTNVLQVVPQPGSTPADVQRSVFAVPGVALAESVGESAEAFDEALDEFTGILRIAQGAVLALVLLIAFNAASIGVDERAREHATMFAFGLPVRQVLALTTVESLVTGLLGTMVGVAAGYGVLQWMVSNLMSTSLPDLRLTVYVAPATLIAAVVLGVITVGIAPLFTVRKLRRMDVPATLRVVE
jgi:putative ABC transport system permease protein